MTTTVNKNNFLIFGLIFAVVFVYISLSLLFPQNLYNLGSKAQIAVYPTVTLTSQSKYSYVTYTCNYDLRNGSYVLTSSNECKTVGIWKKEAAAACNQKSGGVCYSTTQNLASCLASYKLSPECATKPYYLTPTPWVTKYPTITPICLSCQPSVYPTRITPTPWWTVYPTKYLTPTPGAQCYPPVSCPAPPTGCSYKGGNSCYCGEIVCAVP